MTSLDPTEQDEQLPTISSRYWIAVAVFIAAVALLLLLGIRNQPALAVIEGPSMAPGFLGTHWIVTCSECRFSWPRHDSSAQASAGIVCPNCAVRVPDPQQTPGTAEQVHVDRQRFRTREPQRWEVVAIRRDGEWNVKRIVGLPGEEVSLRDGNLLINGKLCDFTADVWRSQALLLHDDRFRSPQAADDGRGWHSIDSSERWRPTANGYHLHAKDGETALAELQYTHMRFVFGRQLRAQALPVVDDDHYNSGPPRELNAVSDLAVRLRVSPLKCTELILSLHDGIGWNDARWSHAEQAWQLRQSNDVLASKPAAELTTSEYEFITRDGRLLLTVNRQPLLAAMLSERTSEKPTPLPSFARISARGELEISDVQIFRDVVYLSPTLTTQEWHAPRRLEADEYFVLGDNSPVSLDSRTWKNFAVRRDEISGGVQK
jgi:signal peptidase I